MVPYYKYRNKFIICKILFLAYAPYLTLTLYLFSANVVTYNYKDLDHENVENVFYLRKPKDG